MVPSIHWNERSHSRADLARERQNEEGRRRLTICRLARGAQIEGSFARRGAIIALTGLLILLLAKAVQSIAANRAPGARISDWLSDRTIHHGMPVRQVVFSAVFMVLIVAAQLSVGYDPRAKFF